MMEGKKKSSSIGSFLTLHFVTFYENLVQKALSFQEI